MSGTLKGTDTKLSIMRIWPVQILFYFVFMVVPLFYFCLHFILAENTHKIEAPISRDILQDIAPIEDIQEDIQEDILVLGWTNGKTKPSVWQNYDNWFHLTIGVTKSFQVCYEKNFLDEKYRCSYTDDKDQYDEADALLFRGRLLKHVELPTRRLYHQKWIFFEHEPPTKVWLVSNLTAYNTAFNVTATYAMDSDVPKSPYIRRCVRNEPLYSRLASKNYASQKRRDVLVAWFASVCKTQSQREEYVKKLQTHLAVDVYGKCGPLTCGSARTWSTDKCDEKLLHEPNSYKFYLAFENSLCEDYISEKLWKLMSLDVVPVVMGAVDYANMLPRNSYIDVRDFASPEDLAAYLKHLDQNDELYNEYIRNKQSLNCKISHIPWECSLCKYLHEHKSERKVVHSLDYFWGSRRCMKPEHYLDPYLSPAIKAPKKS